MVSQSSDSSSNMICLISLLGHCCHWLMYACQGVIGKYKTWRLEFKEMLKSLYGILFIKTDLESYRIFLGWIRLSTIDPKRLEWNVKYNQSCD